MSQMIADLLALPVDAALFLAAVVFAAGVVRGFTGFALSAFVMSLAVTILPPVELIAMLYWLEMAASLVMARAGWRHADRRAALILVVGSAMGTFAGLGLILLLDTGLSRTIALGLLILASALQLARLRLPFLATTPGTLSAGVTAGLASGLAGIGGMVVALYVLARQVAPDVMRATLVVYLFGGMATSLASHTYWGTMTSTALARGLVMVPVCLAGVWLGIRFFTPESQRHYRTLCLWLLIVLASLSLIRHLS